VRVSWTRHRLRAEERLLVSPAPVEVDLPPLRPALLGGARLLIETAVIPTVLFGLVLHFSGLRPAFAAALGWCYLVTMARWVTGRRLPGTLMLCVGVFTGRALAALWMSSALLFLMQPVLGSLLMAALFVGSALLGRPVTMRLARDFVTLPSHVLHRIGVRRMFRDIALLWGASRVVDAAVNVLFLHRGIDAGLLARGVFSPLFTVLTIAVCAYWGVRALRAEGIRLRRCGTSAEPTG
jgi:hypothetical protein